MTGRVVQWFSSAELARAVTQSIRAQHSAAAAHSSAGSETQSGSTLEVEAVDVSELGGAHVSPRVLRLDVRFALGDDQRGLMASFVQKYSRSQEREAMVLLNPMVNDHPLPRLLGSGEDEFGLWLLMPYIDGVLREEFTLPNDVVQTLAHVHAKFEDEEALTKALPKLDGDFLARALHWTQAALDRKEGIAVGHRSFLEGGLVQLREATQILRTAGRLPQTLLHGDVHPGNVIECHADQQSVLFDWGNAMVGPAGVDLTNCIASIDDPAWTRYWNIVGRLQNAPVAAEQQAAQFSFGKVVISIQYLPFSIQHLSASNSARMMREALRHSGELEKFR